MLTLRAAGTSCRLTASPTVGRGPALSDQNNGAQNWEKKIQRGKKKKAEAAVKKQNQTEAATFGGVRARRRGAGPTGSWQGPNPSHSHTICYAKRNRMKKKKTRVRGQI